ncbi:hypothetical protein GGP41_003121 [Bipolaris sorokiniana]|uniref:Uncharacterized protein n=1 Tax=Cochliobolus sativus TaxID=45130 RepID=A0A8H5ZA21_COCSA|nr:hypothetical protein GGP41_003121 [Bipolaris sorokiniana]
MREVRHANPPIILESVSPPMLTENLNGLRDQPPQQVEDLANYLVIYIDLQFIPRGFKDIIKNDSDVDHQIIGSANFNLNDALSAQELSAV